MLHVLHLSIPKFILMSELNVSVICNRDESCWLLEANSLMSFM
jgi:hypothetical protein